eukprot:TRINITY_DN94579_c0_g1_i1.p1 TRINITY_DN94579_c0_g1~~TRINITY_DN94579_c0_g1_i1.p1  ORF type:complete len:260 (+),score=64.30 TRINITY_DN94579_c0_g1_i1:58-837(+)
MTLTPRGSMASSGMAVLGGGKSCTREAGVRDSPFSFNVLPSQRAGLAEKDLLSSFGSRQGVGQTLQSDYHVDFDSEPPRETAALWVGTPYAKWIERDVRLRVAQESSVEIEKLREQLQEEKRQREALEQELQEANAKLRKIPEMEATMENLRSVLIRYVEKSSAGSALGSVRGQCIEIMREWRKFTIAQLLYKARNMRPDLQACNRELDMLHAASLEHMTSMRLQMQQTVARYMDGKQQAWQLPGDDEEGSDAQRISMP